MVETKKSQPSSSGNPFAVLPAEFGRYRVLKLLGRGGMGAVYLAEDTQLGRQVALKLPFIEGANSAQRAERFVREARSAAMLQHPNICTVFDAGQIDGRPFITMAYVAGSPLADEIDPDEPMPQRRAAEVARKLALALDHAHGEGTVHRDLKPANVMMTPKGEPVVMDFGLAKRFADVDPGDKQLTRLGGVIGTPSYMSPEQAKGEGVGPATDIYSLGVMLFEMLAGRTPYAGSQGVVMGQILHAPVPPVREFRPAVDARLDAICQKAMAKEPQDRYASMAEFAAALEGYLNGVVEAVPVSPRPSRPITPAPTEASAWAQDTPSAGRRSKKRPRRMHRGMIAGIAVALMVPLTGLFLLAPGGDKNRSQPRKSEQKTPPKQPLEKKSPAPLPEKVIENSIGMKLVRIPAGKFSMGSPEGEAGRERNEGPEHEVEITKDFYLGVYEVTQGEYEAVMGTNPSHFAPGGDGKAAVADQKTAQFPVENVSYEDAVKFCERLSALPEEKGKNRLYRLPGEAEWEYACRGGAGPKKTPFHYGTSLSSGQANFRGDQPYGGAAMGTFLARTCTVGSYEPNAFGLYDMHGNVWEWCSDWFGDESYADSPKTDPRGPTGGWGRVFRGSSWLNPGSACRSACRGRGTPTLRHSDVGFRVAADGIEGVRPSQVGSSP